MKFESKFGSGGGGGDTFIKLDDGESVTGVFAGDPYEFKQHNKWPAKPTLCTGVGCEDCLAGENAATRFRINLIVKEGGELKAKIFEQGWHVWVTLQELNSEYDLSRYTVKIKRTGEKTETRYTILPIPKGELDDAALGKLKAIELCNLYHKGVEPEKKEAAPPVEEMPDFDEDSDVPF